MRTIAIVNQKGGCGKTTTAINLAGVLARRGQRTLLVDLDPQSHCAVGLGIPDDGVDMHIGDAMLLEDPTRFDESRLLWRINRNLDLAPSAMKLVALEAARGGLADAADRDQRLVRVLDRFRDRYEWVLIDCPPAIGLLTYNALRAADETVIPVETSFFAMKGADRQVRTIRSLARRLGGQTPYRILATMHDPESSLASELLHELDQQFGDRLIPHVIRLDRKLKEAATFGQPLVDYDPDAAGARDYAAVAEFLNENAPGKTRARPHDASTVAAVEKPVPITQTKINSIAPPVQPTAMPEVEVPATQSRAADLARRARQLLERSAEIQSRLEADADVNAAMRRMERPERPHPEAAESKRSQLARILGAVETSRGVLFSYVAPPGRRVAIAGDFNRWSDSTTPLRYNDSVGVYETIVELPPGRCEYRLVVDGHWQPDPYNRNTTVNPFGERNSVVVVTRRTADQYIGEGAD
ncbi:MAG: hypothetical protein EA376_07975 [Phycisphaeraceae bacterium]|nr:MAG: hypothetical protein EA376_07975 [Phycisphaeraceae bacterium]